MVLNRRGLVVVLASSLLIGAVGGCSEAGRSAADVDPWHARIDEYLAGSTSGFIRSVLDDYNVEPVELDEAADRYSECLEPHGLYPEIDNDQALYGVEDRSIDDWIASGRDLAAMDEVVAQCADSTIGPVGMFYRDMRENPLAQDYGPALYRCLQVHAGLSEDAAREISEGVVPEPVPSTVSECLADPFTPA